MRVAVESPGTGRIGIDDLVKQLGSGPRKWKRAREQFIEDHAEAVDITAMVDRMCRVAADRLLRAHVSRSPDDRAILGQMDRLLVEESQAEIDDPWFT